MGGGGTAPPPLPPGFCNWRYSGQKTRNIRAKTTSFSGKLISPLLVFMFFLLKRLLYVLPYTNIVICGWYVVIEDPFRHGKKKVHEFTPPPPPPPAERVFQVAPEKIFGQKTSASPPPPPKKKKKKKKKTKLVPKYACMHPTQVSN